MIPDPRLLPLLRYNNTDYQTSWIKSCTTTSIEIIVLHLQCKCLPVNMKAAPQ